MVMLDCRIPAKEPQSLPCRVRDADAPKDIDPWTHAPFAICGRLPHNTGGGVLYWCYSLEDAIAGMRWCQESNHTLLRIVSYDRHGHEQSTLMRLV